jgi:hypothetical protein
VLAPAGAGQQQQQQLAGGGDSHQWHVQVNLPVSRASWGGGAEASSGGRSLFESCAGQLEKVSGQQPAA